MDWKGVHMVQGAVNITNSVARKLAEKILIIVALPKKCVISFQRNRDHGLTAFANVFRTMIRNIANRHAMDQDMMTPYAHLTHTFFVSRSAWKIRKRIR